MKPVPPEVRFWAKVRKVEGDGCWLWTAGCSPLGYGVFHPATRTTKLASRMAWTFTHGPIPDGLYVCHNCPGGDNPTCVRPSHMFLGTPADNQSDACRKGRRARKLTPADVADIRRRAPGYTKLRLAEEYGVAPSLISAIVSGKKWKHHPTEASH